MQTEDNKAVVRRFWEEVFNKGNLDAAYELFAANHVIHIPSLQIDEVGVDAMKTLVAVPRTVSPDILATINDQVAEGDKVVTSWTARGTLAGEMRVSIPKMTR
jgi:predicted SnoaL-like aldol condensation-catalyzing enzyme